MKLTLALLATFTFAIKDLYRRNLQDNDPDQGCPASDGLAPDFDYTFPDATIVHRNLAGRYCEYRGNTESDGCEHTDPNTGKPVEEILFCNMDSGSYNGLLCLRITDISLAVDDSTGARLYPDAVPYDCDPRENYYKCGNVHLENSDFGQIQLQLTGTDSTCRLEFQTVDCRGSSVDPSTSFDPSTDTYQGCTPIEWNTMTMTFLDIDGTNQYEEKLVMHDVVHFDVAETFEDGSRFDEQDRCFPTDPAGFVCDLDDEGNPIGYGSSRRCFPNLQVHVWDPSGTYIQKDCSGNRLTTNGINFGDVTVFNFLESEVTDGYANKQANILNPDQEDALSNLLDRQLSRSITGYWASTAYINPRIEALVDAGVLAPQSTLPPETRNSFQVSMGTMKRTIMFAGRSESISGEACETCANLIGTDGEGCKREFPSGNFISYPDRVCNYDPWGITNQCTYSYCCTETSTSHGDPIIWTFDEECYDLNKDGLWLATSHPEHNHKVNIAVYNDYMREIQVVFGDKIGLSINSLGEVMNNNYPFAFEEVTVECPEDMKDCIDEYKEFRFDAQDFSYTVHMLRHNYLDAALKKGEYGYHLDIYPRPYRSFAERKAKYTGLYFENPLPEELEYCAGGSPRE